MINYLLDLIVTNSGTIGTFLITTLVALLKRWLDRKSIKRALLSRGMDSLDIDKIV